MKMTYDAIAYKQARNSNSPWIISFVATAEDLLEWVGIPRRSENGLVGFQRLDNQDRVIRAKDFFLEPNNQSPTALILGIHETPPNGIKSINLVFKTETGDIRPCTIEVNFDKDALTDDDLKKIIKQQIMHRLTQDQSSYDVGTEDDDELDNDEQQQSDDEDDEQQESRGGNIELGRSLLNDLLTKLEDPEWLKQNREALVDYAKPATLIDGQHRIKGAELAERDGGIPFTVCALYNCSWSECLAPCLCTSELGFY